MSKQAIVKERGGRSGTIKSAKTIRNHAKKVQRPATTVESILLIQQITAVPDQAELLHLIDHIVEQYTQDESPIVQVERRPNSLTYHFSKKKVAMSVARHIQRAYKHLKPDRIVENPYDQLFERVVLIFSP